MVMGRCWYLAALLLGALGACSKPAPKAAIPAVSTPPQAPTAAPTPTKGPLVIGVIFDQFGADTLERLLPLLDKQGALRMGIARGAFYPQVAYPHAVTLTAPGHALLYTGATPAVTSITGNAVARGPGRLSSSVDDGQHPVLGVDGLYAGPALLKAPTVGDALVAERGAQGAQVISISLKDRSAILPGGQKAALALWYEDSIPGFTTSSYYAREIPKFVIDYELAHPLLKLTVPWEFSPSAVQAPILGPDDAAGESDYAGFGTTFPHDPARSASLPQVLRLTPALSEYLIGLAEAAVSARHLGEDDVPDLLLLSISGTDYAGHAFGPHSWEYFDHVRRADRALGAMLRRLEQHAEISVVITSDHGVAALPEHDHHGAGSDRHVRLR